MTTPIKIDSTISQLIKANGVEYIAPSISQIIHEAYLDAGIKNTSDEDKYLLIGRFTKEICESYGYLTGVEIRKAIHDGILGRYGEYMGISLRTLCRFLDKYLESPERAALVSHRQHAMAIQDTSRLLAEKGTRTPEDELNSLKAMINFSYSRWIWIMTNSIVVNDTRRSSRAFDSSGIIRKQLIQDKLMSEDESIVQAYTRFYKQGLKKIYNYD